jgi:hypothetical protein
MHAEIPHTREPLDCGKQTMHKQASTHDHKDCLETHINIYRYSEQGGQRARGHALKWGPRSSSDVFWVIGLSTAMPDGYHPNQALS